MRWVCRSSAPKGIVLLLAGSMAACLAEEPPKSLLTVERIFCREEFKTQDLGPIVWLKDNSGYTVLEKSESLKNGMDIVRYEPESGRREVLVRAADLAPRGKSQPLKIEDYAWSDDNSKLLIFTCHDSMKMSPVGLN